MLAFRMTRTTRSPIPARCMNSIDLKSVSKSFGPHQALSKLDLSVPVGEIVAILGPSGAGKTTMLRILAGLEKPCSGRVLFDGRDAVLLSPVERNVALVLQDYAVYPQLSVTENLKAALKRCGLSKSEVADRIAETLDWFHLSQYAQRRPAQLSGGQLQRVALAKAVVQRPELLLLDEPFSQLDMELREQLRELLLDLHARFPSTILFVTHDPLDAMRIASTVAILDAGRILTSGRCEEVYRQPISRTAANLISPLGINWLKFELIRQSESDDVTQLTTDKLLGLKGRSQVSAALTWHLSKSRVDLLLSRFDVDSRPKSVWLGIRPETVRLISSSEDRHGIHGLGIHGTVKNLQSLGFAQLATLIHEQVSIKILLTNTAVAPTGLLAVHIPEDELLWFADQP